jgi:hypothetical protein
MRKTTDLEVKWGIHPAGDKRAAWTEGEERSTLVILVSGKFHVDLSVKTPADPQPEWSMISVALERQGDYLTWGRGTALMAGRRRLGRHYCSLAFNPLRGGATVLGRESSPMWRTNTCRRKCGDGGGTPSRIRARRPTAGSAGRPRYGPIVPGLCSRSHPCPPTATPASTRRSAGLGMKPTQRAAPARTHRRPARVSGRGAAWPPPGGCSGTPRAMRPPD